MYYFSALQFLCTSTSLISTLSFVVPSRIVRSKLVGNISTRNSIRMVESDPVVDLELPSPLILGSGSFTRKLILKEMGINFHLLVMPIDEKAIGDRSSSKNVVELVSLLAKAKGDRVAETIASDAKIRESLKGEEWVVLTADQVVVQGDSILEKPESIVEAKSMVQSYGSSAPKTVGACVLTHIPSMTQVSGYDSAQINFNELLSESSDDLVDRLLSDNAPVLSCAGGLMVEHPFVRDYISSIDGTEDSVMGLSKDLVLKLLKELKQKLN